MSLISRVGISFCLRRHLKSLGVRSITGSSVDENELSKFRKLADKWWNGAEFSSLRNMNQLRVPFVAEPFIATAFKKPHVPLDGIRILDIGCGGGILSEALARLGATVVGIDPVRESISAAIVHADTTFARDPHRQPTYKCCTIEELSADFRVGEFDAIVASEVVEHVDNLNSFLECTIGCLRPGGHLFVTTINQTPLSYFAAIIAAERILKLLPRGTHDYERFVPPKAFSLLLKDRKFFLNLREIFVSNPTFSDDCDVVKVHGMFLNPLTLQWSWTQNQSVNYALMATKRSPKT